MSQEEVFINGELLKLRREARGWALGDLATRACMSVKQIRQLEEGGLSSFYSQAVKLTSAKKVATLLGVQPEEIFSQFQEPVTEALTEVAHEGDSEDLSHASSESPTENVVDAVTDTPAHVPSVPSVHAPETTAESSTKDEAKSKTSLWVIAGLFAAALAVAAYMQPKDEAAAEPAPPLQVLPADADTAASAAEADASSASAASEPVAPSASAAQKTASSAVANSNVAAPAASATRVASASSAAIATTAVKPASAASVPAANSTASAAKPL